MKTQFGPFTFSPPRVGLSALAGMFHQDFDLHGVTFREAVEVQVAAMPQEEREQLRAELKDALRKYPDPLSFEDYFVRLGAENWVDGDPRADLEALLAKL